MYLKSVTLRDSLSRKFSYVFPQNKVNLLERFLFLFKNK